MASRSRKTSASSSRAGKRTRSLPPPPEPSSSPSPKFLLHPIQPEVNFDIAEMRQNVFPAVQWSLKYLERVELMPVATFSPTKVYYPRLVRLFWEHLQEKYNICLDTSEEEDDEETDTEVGDGAGTSGTAGDD